MDKRTSRTIRVNGRRTSLRLCLPLWEALEDIAERENSSLRLIVEKVDELRGRTGLTIALRVFALSYLRAAADGYFEKKRPGRQKQAIKEEALKRLVG